MAAARSTRRCARSTRSADDRAPGRGRHRRRQHRHRLGDRVRRRRHGRAPARHGSRPGSARRGPRRKRGSAISPPSGSWASRSPRRQRGSRRRPTLDLAVAGAGHVQECVPEQLELKQRLFARLDALAPADCPIASSSSFMAASPLGRGPARPRRAASSSIPATRPTCCAWPSSCRRRSPRRRPSSAPRPCCGVPAWCRCGSRARSRASCSTGCRGPCCARPTAWCATASRRSPTSTSSCATASGLRWAVIGPFETADLNTRGGIAAHALRMGPAYARMGAERGQDDPWTPELVAEVHGPAPRGARTSPTGRARRLARPHADGAAAGARGRRRRDHLRRPRAARRGPA